MDTTMDSVLNGQPFHREKKAQTRSTPVARPHTPDKPKSYKISNPSETSSKPLLTPLLSHTRKKQKHRAGFNEEQQDLRLTERHRRTAGFTTEKTSNGSGEGK
ncbi:hypothetical protein F511_37976 [Dorcoceras hygrometricum]|uniref:Uncharacterized protein n=1 Tax=Dorcoceras hygrometricum TaxID=472368 RepID=A0A2Z7CI60_9LAMI|nr:hypothetical protein F511_37976 [Dorcoceras hygrometricum]